VIAAGPIRALGYVRRSVESEGRVGAASLEDQAARIAEYARAKGWELVDTVTDNGVSGGKRERFGRLDGRLRATGARRLICYHADRLARDTAGLLDWLDRWTRRGVEVHTVERGRLETRSASNFLLVGVEAVASEHFRRLVAEKTADAMHRLRLRGQRISGLPPYGWRFFAGGTLAPVPAEQQTLVRIRALRGRGLGVKRIIRALTEAGVMARSGQPFQRSTVRGILARLEVMESESARADLVMSSDAAHVS
jgi:DNA invertase Pin-like site-specific DNA recombinase